MHNHTKQNKETNLQRKQLENKQINNKNKHTKYVIELQRNKQNKENYFKNKPNRIPTKP